MITETRLTWSKLQNLGHYSLYNKVAQPKDRFNQAVTNFSTVEKVERDLQTHFISLQIYYAAIDW